MNELRCFYRDHSSASRDARDGCYRRAIRSGSCITKSVGEIEVCGQHLHYIVRDGSKSLGPKDAQR